MVHCWRINVLLVKQSSCVKSLNCRCKVKRLLRLCRLSYYTFVTTFVSFGVLSIHLIFPVKRLVALAIKAVIFFCAGISNHFFHCIFEYVFPWSKGRFEIIRSTGISFPSSRTLYTCIPFTNSSKMQADFVYGIEIFLNQYLFASRTALKKKSRIKDQEVEEK